MNILLASKATAMGKPVPVYRLTFFLLEPSQNLEAGRAAGLAADLPLALLAWLYAAAKELLEAALSRI